MKKGDDSAATQAPLPASPHKGYAVNLLDVVGKPGYRYCRYIVSWTNSLSTVTVKNREKYDLAKFTVAIFCSNLQASTTFSV